MSASKPNTSFASLGITIINEQISNNRGFINICLSELSSIIFPIQAIERQKNTILKINSKLSNIISSFLIILIFTSIEAIKFIYSIIILQKMFKPQCIQIFILLKYKHSSYIFNNRGGMCMYTQAFGALLGLIACLYGYVYGDLLLIGKVPFSDTTIISTICGYTLYPLCWVVFLFSFIFKDKLHKVNKYITHTTVAIGLLGCKYYFIIPGLLILYNFYMPVIFEDDIRKRDEKIKKQEAATVLLNQNVGKHTIIKLLNISYEELEEIQQR